MAKSAEQQLTAESMGQNEKASGPSGRGFSDVKAWTWLKNLEVVVLKLKIETGKVMWNKSFIHQQHHKVIQTIDLCW